MVFVDRIMMCGYGFFDFFHVRNAGVDVLWGMWGHWSILGLCILYLVWKGPHGVWPSLWWPDMQCCSVSWASSYRTCMCNSVSGLKRGGKKLTLVPALWCVLVCKSTRFDLAGYLGDIHLDLEHQSGNIVLLIICYISKGTKGDFVTKRGFSSEFIDRLTDSGVAMTVHRCGPNWCQILLDLTTVGYFDSCFPGPSNYIDYMENFQGVVILSETSEVYRHAILDLQPATSHWIRKVSWSVIMLFCR